MSRSWCLLLVLFMTSPGVLGGDITRTGTQGTECQLKSETHGVHFPKWKCQLGDGVLSRSLRSIYKRHHVFSEKNFFRLGKGNCSKISFIELEDCNVLASDHFRPSQFAVFARQTSCFRFFVCGSNQEFTHTLPHPNISSSALGRHIKWRLFRSNTWLFS